MVEIRLPDEWQGDTPVFLLIIRSMMMSDGVSEVAYVIDLDERGWATTWSELMRAEGTWHLVHKDERIYFSLIVREGEQPYYVARHFARAALVSGQEQAQVTAYGIGKKRLDGHVDRLWVLYPSGQVCAGDDVDIFGKVALDQL